MGNREEVQERDNHAASFTKMLFPVSVMLPEGLEPERHRRASAGGNKTRWGMPIPTSEESGSVAKTCADREEQHPGADCRTKQPNVHVVSDLRQDDCFVWLDQCYLKYSYPILNELIKRQRNGDLRDARKIDIAAGNNTDGFLF